jgi:hypothetical protein
MSAVVALSVRPNHRLNAIFLNRLLLSQPLASRDGFWSLLLYDSFENREIVFQLIDWSHRADLSSLSHEAVHLRATALAWFCASPDRRIRDRSTKGLVRLFVSHPDVITSLTARFQDCDDDYVLERVLAAAYGALLLSSDEESLVSMAGAAYQMLLGAADNTNALIRDHARLILEFAKEKVGDRLGHDIREVRPPYASLWPPQTPSKSEVNPFLEDDRFPYPMREDARGGGVLGSDFARYVIEPRVLSSFDLTTASLDIGGICRWLLKSAIEMGYPGANNLCAGYDYRMLRNYGGGRGKPGWAEHIGKKYYWILLHRLVGKSPIICRASYTGGTNLNRLH